MEVSGGAKRHHSPGPVSEKADTARHLWAPAVNRHGGWGLWGYVEVRDPSSARRLLAEALEELRDTDPVSAARRRLVRNAGLMERNEERG